LFHHHCLLTEYLPPWFRYHHLQTKCMRLAWPVCFTYFTNNTSGNKFQPIVPLIIRRDGSCFTQDVHYGYVAWTNSRRNWRRAQSTCSNLSWLSLPSPYIGHQITRTKSELPRTQKNHRDCTITWIFSLYAYDMKSFHVVPARTGNSVLLPAVLIVLPALMFIQFFLLLQFQILLE
jgi:hypothetical protein